MSVIRDRFAEFLARLRSGAPERERLAAILELNRALATAEDRGTVLRLLLDEAIRLFRAERGFVVLAEPHARPPWRIELARSLDREPVQRPERKVSSTIIQRCLETGDGVFADDAQAGDLSAAQSVADLQLRSVLCMPLSVGDRRLGCIYLDHRFRAAAFRADDLPWFAAFADQGAIVLHLHEMLERLRAESRSVERRNRELAAEVVAQAEKLGELEQNLSRAALRHEYAEIKGSSPALLRHLQLLDRVTEMEFPVLLVGESGVGKELAARAIWRHGRFAHGPFVPINVAAMQPELIESELFGHVKGAFTGADRERQGVVREADGGVLFLDEVTEMPLDLQSKLLRVLEDRRVRPVGGDRSDAVRLRVVAATNKDPVREVEEGRFRADLYYRLAVVTVRLPPLRERLGDLRELVEHFLAEAASARGGTPRRTTPELLAELERRPWPGNVRQLRNELLRLDALTEGDLLDAAALKAAPAAPDSAHTTLDLLELERRAVREALRVSGGNKAEAARLLGISRRSLYDRLKRSGEL